MIIHQIENFRSRLRNLIHAKSTMRRISNRRFTINEFDITSVEYLGMSKLGNISWKGLINKDKVKIVEIDNNDHAKTVYEIMCMPDLKEFFPQPFFRVDKYLVLEWLDGISLDRIFLSKAEKYVENIFWFQYTLHNSLSKLESLYRYDYFNYLSERYHKYSGPFCENGTRYAKPHINSSDIQQRFFHLDVTPRNIIVVGNTLKIIDNELLGYGIYYPFDFLNTYEAIKNHRCSSHYVGLIGKHSTHYLNWADNCEDIILYYWALRLCGSYMQSQKSVCAVTNDIVSLDSHPIIKLLERSKNNNDR